MTINKLTCGKENNGAVFIAKVEETTSMIHAYTHELNQAEAKGNLLPEHFFLQSFIYNEKGLATKLTLCFASSNFLMLKIYYFINELEVLEYITRRESTLTNIHTNIFKTRVAL